MPEFKLLLAIDTCGPTGSVTLGGVDGQSVEILGQIELEGRNYSSTLVAAVSELLAQAGIKLSQLHAIVAVNGPGSFTGVRVGLAAVKGLAEAARIPVVAVSRLEVLAAKAGVESSALDAHRHEVFLRLGVADESISERVPQLRGSHGQVFVRGVEIPILEPGKPRLSTGFVHKELLAGAQELAAIVPPPSRVALCDEAAAELVSEAWPEAELIRASAPTAADALLLSAPRVAAGEFVDLALLDGHYLRRSDAEIFGAGIAVKPAATAPEGR
jgi:tRNA threonylcarbamoyladenosine biosynthesis protein TsaB